MESLPWIAMNDFQPQSPKRRNLMSAEPIDNLAGALLANRNLLAALTRPSIALTVDAEGGALPVSLTSEDLTRVLVNLVKNAAEAMPSGGRIQLSLREGATEPAGPLWLTLTIEDNGPGIPTRALKKVFEAGYTTRSKTAGANGGGWPDTHRGLGLSITRSIVEAAGGRIHAANRDPAGACFQIELPVQTR
jgi:two-component system sensor histidine kinase ChvG